MVVPVGFVPYKHVTVHFTDETVPGCQGWALFIRDDVKIGDIPNASTVLHLNGKPGINGEAMNCGTCGEPIRTMDGRTVGLVREFDYA